MILAVIVLSVLSGFGIPLAFFLGWKFGREAWELIHASAAPVPSPVPEQAKSVESQDEQLAAVTRDGRKVPVRLGSLEPLSPFESRNLEQMS